MKHSKEFRHIFLTRRQVVVKKLCRTRQLRSPHKKQRLWMSFTLVLQQLLLFLYSFLLSLLPHPSCIRGVDVKKRTETTHSYNIRFGHNISNCLFSFSFIDHILIFAIIQFMFTHFPVTFLLLNTIIQPSRLHQVVYIGIPGNVQKY